MRPGLLYNVVTAAPLKALAAFVVTPQRDSASAEVLAAQALGQGLFHTISKGGARAALPSTQVRAERL